VQTAFVDALGKLENSGVIEPVELVDLGDISHLLGTFRTIQAAEAWRVHGEWVTAHPGELGADIAARFDIASRVTAEEEAAARETLAAARTQLDEALAGRILLLPSTSSTAPQVTAEASEIEAVRAATLGLTCVAGIGGYPALSVPLLEIDGAPAGVCLVGPRFTDLALLDIAANFVP
jgi:Asp-tRNA(Asn)/Glu-tRNA(Gln) amidotransferase A subunit family amidase